jgi:hypothetical protein
MLIDPPQLVAGGFLVRVSRRENPGIRKRTVKN